MFIETNSKYGSGFVIQEYNGKISLVSARQGKDKVWLKFGEIEVGKDKTARLPVSVDLGEGPESALRSLRSAAEMIKAGKYDKQGKDDNPPI